jgi:hypothetical protein
MLLISNLGRSILRGWKVFEKLGLFFLHGWELFRTKLSRKYNRALLTCHEARRYRSSGNPVGFIDFKMEFKYLVGSIVHHSLTSDADADKRFRSASAAFGALKNILTKKKLISKSKEAPM